jgi:hypothetical protein
MLFGGPANGIGGLQPGGLLRLMGSLGLWTALLLMAGAALIGVLLSLAADKDPGMLLGFFVIVGSIAAVLGIRRNLVYLVFPAPALTLFVSAILLGKIHDAKLSSSTAGLASGFAQWIAGIFVPAMLATVIVVLVGGGRWLLGRQLGTGTSRLVATSNRGVPDAAPGRTRRPAAVDSWADDNPFEAPDARTPRTGPSPRQGSRPQPQFDDAPNGTRPPRDQRPAPDQRPDSGRDQWGDPGRPADRERSVPPATSRPPQAPGRPAQPRDRTGPRPQPPGAQPPGPSWSPNGQRPARPARPQPPDGWTR